jgi:hypothetical protein
MDAQTKQLLDHLGRQAETTGGVLAVGNHQVHLIFVDQAVQLAGQRLTSRLTNDIAYKEYFYSHLTFYSIDRKVAILNEEFFVRSRLSRDYAET